MLVAPRSIAAKNLGIGRWALTLAPSVIAPARRGRALGERGLGPGSPPALGAATAVPPALGLAVHPALGVRRYCRLARLRRHRRAAARHSGLQ